MRRSAGRAWLQNGDLMSDGNQGEDRDLAAGEFSAWMVEIQAAIRGDGGTTVPCGGCTACCTSSHFVHIGPEETDTLAHIPRELLFPAPRLPAGHVVLGYDERGHCPMLIDNQCSIYQHRPRTCRTYDCRVFPATGVEIADHDKVLIARQARRWRFGFPTQADRDLYDAVRAAATALGAQSEVESSGAGQPSATQRAVLAIQTHQAFLPPAKETD
jgi:Fe-S-cluster containining protein